MCLPESHEKITKCLKNLDSKMLWQNDRNWLGNGRNSWEKCRITCLVSPLARTHATSRSNYIFFLLFSGVAGYIASSARISRLTARLNDTSVTRKHNVILCKTKKLGTPCMGEIYSKIFGRKKFCLGHIFLQLILWKTLSSLCILFV